MVYLLPILAVVVAVAFIIGYYFFRKDSLYVLGIGAAVSSNVYNVNAYSIDAGWLIFGLDSVIYILFVFCVMVACKDFGKQSAKAITFSSMAGIMLTAIFDFFAKWATIGIAKDVIWGFVSFAISVCAIYLSISLGLWLYEKMRNKCAYFVNLGVSIVVSSVTNSIIYFGVMFIIGADLFGNFFGTLVGSVIGKIGTLLILLCAYEVVRLLDNKKKLKSNAETLDAMKDTTEEQK